MPNRGAMLVRFYMKKQSGFTLIELMISFVIGLIIIAATISIYTITVRSSSDTVKSARLNHDLESAMMLMVNDIRRAGYWGGAIADSDSSKNPFVTGNANIQIPSASCILYTYDANDSGSLTRGNQADDVDANEYYGFKLDGNTINMRLTGTTTADCANGTWEENIYGTDIKITTLNFTTAYKCLDGSADPPASFNSTCAVAVPAGTLPGHKIVESRRIIITLTGELADDPKVKKTLTSTVKVRNDRIFIQP